MQTCKHALEFSVKAGLSASLALLPLLRLGSSLALVLLLLLRPTWPTLRGVHLFWDMRSDIFVKFLLCVSAVES